MHFEYEGFSFVVDDLAIKTTLFIAVSGSHAYGWSREDSDLDIRRVWIPDIKQALSIFFRAKVKSHQHDKQDFVASPIGHWLLLLAKGNANKLENLFQYHLYEKSNLTGQLKKIVLENLHQGFLKCYLGHSKSLKKDLYNPTRMAKYGPEKLLLSSYRVLLAGLILEDKQQVVFNLEKQLERYPSIDSCLPLLTLYRDGKSIGKDLKHKCIQETNVLRSALEEKIESTSLPEKKLGSPTIRLERWLINYYLKKEEES